MDDTPQFASPENQRAAQCLKTLVGVNWKPVHPHNEEWLMSEKPLSYAQMELLGALKQSGIIGYDDDTTKIKQHATLTNFALDRLEILADGHANPQTTVNVAGLKLVNGSDVSLKEHCNWLNTLNHSESTQISALAILGGEEKSKPFGQLSQGIRIVRADKDNVLELIAKHLRAYFPEAADKITLSSMDLPTAVQKFRHPDEQPLPLWSVDKPVPTTSILEITDAAVAAQLVQHGLKAFGYLDAAPSKRTK